MEETGAGTRDSGHGTRTPRASRVPSPESRVPNPGVAVLALQGDFEAHRKKLASIGDRRPSRRGGRNRSRGGGARPSGRGVHDALEVLRGRRRGRRRSRASRRAAGPILGTCAGAIVLAREVTNPARRGMGPDRHRRRAQRLRPAGRTPSWARSKRRPLGGELPAVFIRAPRIRRVGPGVEVLATRGGRAGPRSTGQRRRGDLSPGVDGRRRVHALCFAARGAAEGTERMSLVRVERRGDVAVLTLDRPPANAFSPELVGGLSRRSARERRRRRRSFSPRPSDVSSPPDGTCRSSPPWRPFRLERLSRGLLRSRARDLRLPGPARRGVCPGHAIAGGLIVAAAADERSPRRVRGGSASPEVAPRGTAARLLSSSSSGTCRAASDGDG